MLPSGSVSKPSKDQYLNCIRCGLCLAVCPTYREYLSETTSPRGRVALARKGLEGALELSPNLAGQMYACFDCLACNDICPVGICPADLALEMRHVQEQIRPVCWKQTLFGGLISKPNRMEAATWPLRVYEKLGIRRLVYALGLCSLLPDKIRDLEAMLPHLPQRPLRQMLPEVTQANVVVPVSARDVVVPVPAYHPESRTGRGGETRYRVGFFLGCAQSLMFAEESAASVRILARNGCTVVTPKETVCCGMPALGYGRTDLVREQARVNIALFEKANVETIVTDCATCGSTLKDYDKLLADDPAWAARAAAFSSRVRDVSEFLMSIPLEKPQGRIDARVTYHDSCHLRRGQGVWKQPRELLKMIDGLEFVELPEADWCCGSAGSQLITHYETSLKVLKRKADNIASTQADYIASGCPGCQMQLTLGMRRQGLDVQVVHPIALLDRAYRQQESEVSRLRQNQEISHSGVKRKNDG
ncbi:MAG: (Fe-S)-binding protein [Chloroflexi bacterium]|nr:(Fe-S)-binding protein [Chloroflexota bacterium]